MADPAYDDTNKLSFNYSLSYNFPVTRYVNEKLRLHSCCLLYYIITQLQARDCILQTNYSAMLHCVCKVVCSPGVSREHRLGQVGLGQHSRIPTMDHVSSMYDREVPHQMRKGRLWIL